MANRDVQVSATPPLRQVELRLVHQRRAKRAQQALLHTFAVIAGRFPGLSPQLGRFQLRASARDRLIMTTRGVSSDAA